MYSRGKFGIEFNPPKPDEESSWLGRVFVVAVLVAAAIAVTAVVRRYLAKGGTAVNTVEIASAEVDSAPVAATNAVERPKVTSIDYSGRSTRVRNLLLRLAEADRQDNVEMAITTIEQLRDTTGTADLDDTLARRLGVLNLRRLFELKSAQWTTEVTVKRGDTASRIAYEHGSTLASLVKLNGDSDRIVAGKKLIVMNHPRFNLVISRRTRIADLSLNGKFFKRYYLTSEVSGKEGQYPLPPRFRDFCTEQGVGFKPLDRAEIEMLIPKGVNAYIKEI